MAKTNVDLLSASAIRLEAQPGGTVTPAVVVAAAAASTHKIAVTINGTVYYILLSNV